MGNAVERDILEARWVDETTDALMCEVSKTDAWLTNVQIAKNAPGLCIRVHLCRLDTESPRWRRQCNRIWEDRRSNHSHGIDDDWDSWWYDDIWMYELNNFSFGFVWRCTLFLASVVYGDNVFIIMAVT